MACFYSHLNFLGNLSRRTRYTNQSFGKRRFEVGWQQNMLPEISCASTSSAFCFSQFSQLQLVRLKFKGCHAYWRILRYCSSYGYNCENHSKSSETLLLVVFVVHGKNAKPQNWSMLIAQLLIQHPTPTQKIAQKTHKKHSMQRKAGLSKNQPKKHKIAIFAKPPHWLILKFGEVILVIFSQKSWLGRSFSTFLFLGAALKSVVTPITSRLPCDAKN